MSTRNASIRDLRLLLQPLLAVTALWTTGCEKCAGLEGDARAECEAEEAAAETGGSSGSGGSSSTGATGSGAAAPADNDTANNTPDGCEDLGELEETATFEGRVGGGAHLDNTDFFCFSIATYSTVAVGVARTEDVGGPALNLYSYANSLSTEDVLYTTGQSTAWDLPAGRYAFQMSSNSGGLGLGYQVDITRSELSLTEPDPEPGSTTDEAISLAPTEALTWVEGYVGRQDPSDLYELDVPEGFELGLQLEHVGGGGTIGVQSAPYAAVPTFAGRAVSATAGNAVATLPMPLESGRQLLLVEGDGAYRVGLALLPIAVAE